MTTARIAAASFSALLALGAVGACSDEDGDGGTTDEEIQDGQEAVDSLGHEVEEEFEAQTERADKDGESRRVSAALAPHVGHGAQPHTRPPPPVDRLCAPPDDTPAHPPATPDAPP